MILTFPDLRLAGLIPGRSRVFREVMDEPSALVLSKVRTPRQVIWFVASSYFTYRLDTVEFDEDKITAAWRPLGTFRLPPGHPDRLIDYGQTFERPGGDIVILLRLDDERTHLYVQEAQDDHDL